MNKNLLLVLLCFGISVALIGCKDPYRYNSNEERVSGPFGDNNTNWTESDYK